MTEETLMHHVQFAYAGYITIIVLCACGILFNAVMLWYLLKKKQVLASVYSIYMIQIVATDILVCVVWLVMLVLLLEELPSYQEIQKVLNPTVSEKFDLLSKVGQSVQYENKNFETYRIIFAVYNMHYNVNVFLLAVMSVERCLAVKKSLQCQRYQFKKNIICVVSAAMWVTAIACALPSYINLDWITSNELTDPLLGRANENGNSFLFKPPSEVVLTCYKPLYYAEKNGLSEVSDYKNISVEVCFNFMQQFVFENLDNLQELFRSAPPTFNEAYGQEGDGTVKREVNETESNDWGSGITLDREYYDITFQLFAQAVQILVQKKNNNIDEVCDPKLSKDAKIYQIIINVVVGFLVPFVMIFTTNLYIAYHIWKPAQRRLENSREIKNATQKYCVKHATQQGKYSKAETIGNSKSAKSPVKSQRRFPKSNDNDDDNEFIELQSMKTTESEQLIKSAVVGRKSLPILNKLEHDFSCELYRERPSSYTRTIRKSFRNSTNSAESFPTDLTSLVTCSSPGLPQSRQAFPFGDDIDSLQQTGSSGSSQRSSIKSHSVIPEINVFNEQLQNSLEQMALENNKSVGQKSHPSNPRVIKVKPVRENEVATLEQNSQADSSQQDSLNNKVGRVPIAPSREENKNSSNLTSVNSKTKLIAAVPRRQVRKSESGVPNTSTQLTDGCSNSVCGGTKTRVTLYKNAERQIKLSRIILLYVVVFATCWLPLKMATIIYYTEGYIGNTGHFCHRVLGITRMLSFVSVLFNPVVYAATQKKVNRSLRQLLGRLRLRRCLCACLNKIASKLVTSRRKNDSSDAQCSCIGMEELKVGDLKKERHERNRERWSKIVERLGRKNFRFSYSTSHHVTSKLSNGTIDEEREGLRSNGQSTTST